MNVEIRTEALIFLFWEHLFQIFGILSLQCRNAVVLGRLSPWLCALESALADCSAASYSQLQLLEFSICTQTFVTMQIL
jgi:hypothetical protein